MISRVAKSAILSAAIPLLAIAACADEQGSVGETVPTFDASGYLTEGPLEETVLTSDASGYLTEGPLEETVLTSDASGYLTEGPLEETVLTSDASGYLTEEMPPCTPVEGASVDPCERNVARVANSGQSLNPGLTGPWTIRDYLDGKSRGAFFVIRGTYLPGSVRCANHRVMRFPTFLEGAPTWTIESGIGAISCYADVRVNEYVIGSGPARLTVVVQQVHQWNETATSEQTEAVRSGIESAFIEGGSRTVVSVPNGGIEGREELMFIGPAVNYGVEAWEVHRSWAVEQRGDGTVIAVHPFREYWLRRDSNRYRVDVEKTLEVFKRETQTAHTARLAEFNGRVDEDEDAPILVTNASNLHQHHVNTGNTNHQDGGPSQPLPVPCGLARGEDALLADCEALLNSKDTLRGTGTLNWAAGTAIGSWDGIATGGTPQRITKVELASESLAGSIPAGLGSLLKLTHLDLSSNSLTGSIPVELGLLHSLVSLKLSGNSLTGCIPLALQSVATNDLSSLSLLYCKPPAPGAPTAGTAGEGSVPLSWTAVANTSKYRVEYREGDSGTWTVDNETITTTSHTVDGLQCNTEHQFRVSAFGSGTIYAAAWSDPSGSLTASTGACTPPTFDPTSYRFSVPEDAGVGAAVGTVSATDADPITYAITGTAFAIDDETGAITVAGALDHESTPSYTLTVTADDEKDGTATATVTITVTDVAEDPPPAPTGLGVTLADDTFSLSWDAVTGASKYEAQYTTDAADTATVTWTALPEVTTATATYTPAGGVACGTTYRFRVRAYGDGDTYTAMWGPESGVESVDAPACNRPPEFDQDPYTFEVAEDAGVGVAVGTVSATDPDRDVLTYTITGTAFAIDDETGAITVAAALDHESTPSYTLAVTADDLKGGTDMAMVTITVTDVAEDPPPAPTGLDVTLADATFTLIWTAVTGASKYEVQHTTDAADAATVTWTALPEVTTATTSYTPTDGPTCSTTYRFRVRAYGDGDTYTTTWGTESGMDAVTTASCPPTFAQAAYDFFIVDTAAASSAVGTVSATDPDTDDTVTYAITGGKTRASSPSTPRRGGSRWRGRRPSTWPRPPTTPSPSRPPTATAVRPRPGSGWP